MNTRRFFSSVVFISFVFLLSVHVSLLSSSSEVNGTPNIMFTYWYKLKMGSPSSQKTIFPKLFGGETKKPLTVILAKILSFDEMVSVRKDKIYYSRCLQSFVTLSDNVIFLDESKSKNSYARFFEGIINICPLDKK